MPKDLPEARYKKYDSELRDLEKEGDQLQRAAKSFEARIHDAEKHLRKEKSFDDAEKHLQIMIKGKDGYLQLSKEIDRLCDAWRKTGDSKRIFPNDEEAKKRFAKRDSSMNQCTHTLGDWIPKLRRVCFNEFPKAMDAAFPKRSR